MNLVNVQDVLDVYYRLRRAGLGSITKRLRWRRGERVAAAWEHSETAPKLWTSIDFVRAAAHTRVSGDPTVPPLRWFAETYLQAQRGIRALSLGCGAGWVEMQLAAMADFASIDGIDISRKLIREADERARRDGRRELHFRYGDLLEMDLPEGAYDLVFAHHSLHHFARVERILARAKSALKPGGLLAFEEYVGPWRFQWRPAQLAAMNELLRRIPARYRTRYGLAAQKARVVAPGVLRMLLSDPSEAADSENILPFVRANFEILALKNLGGTIAHALFHDIAHNFAADDPEAMALAKMVMDEESRMIADGTLESDFVFVVARRR
jgi:SAM-dependent methyltransferase